MNLTYTAAIKTNKSKHNQTFDTCNITISFIIGQVILKG